MQRADCGLVTRRSLLPVSNRFHLNPYLLSFIWTLPMNLELLFKCLIPSFPRFASTFLTIQPRPWHCRGQGFDPPRLHQIFQLDLNCSQIGKSVNACLSHLGSLTSNSTTSDPFMMVRLVSPIRSAECCICTAASPLKLAQTRSQTCAQAIADLTDSTRTGTSVCDGSRRAKAHRDEKGTLCGATYVPIQRLPPQL